MSRAEYKRLEEIARAMYAYCENNEDCPDQIGGYACEIMQMIEGAMGQLEGPRWWQP